MDPISLRSFERIIGVLVGGATIFFGYRLFVNTRYETNSEGKVTLPGGVSVIMSRVGPGAFFALFGAILVSLSFVYGVKIDTKSARSVGALPSDDTSYTAYTGMFGARPHDSSDVAAVRAQVQGEIFFLNRTLPTALRVDLDSHERDELAANVRRIKLSLMGSVWDTLAWGNYAQFRRWAERGAQEETPSGSSEAIKYFNAGR